MSISIEEVERIAKLSRLNFTDDEKQKFQHELSGILDYVDQLKQIEGKAPALLFDPDAVNLMRDDVAEQTTPAEEFLKQAPDKQEGFIKVKNILE
jgi:aspartyl-tRNA(Asn)/glutamyl-tRNA(Gln) amidotransferase subunit C